MTETIDGQVREIKRVHESHIRMRESDRESSSASLDRKRAKNLDHVSF